VLALVIGMTKLVDQSSVAERVPTRPHAYGRVIQLWRCAAIKVKRRRMQPLHRQSKRPSCTTAMVVSQVARTTPAGIYAQVLRFHFRTKLTV